MQESFNKVTCARGGRLLSESTQSTSEHFLPLFVKMHFLSRLLHKPKCLLAFDSLAAALAFSTGTPEKKKRVSGDK